MSCCASPVPKAMRVTVSAQPSTLRTWSDKRFMRLAAIILLHVGLLVALRYSLPRTAPQAIPADVFATLIQAESVPEPSPPKPAAALPKAMPVAKLPIARPRPADQAPLPQAVAAATPAAAEPAPPVAAAPVASSSTAPAVAAAPSLPPPAAPKTVTTGVEYLRPPRPDYPPLARRMGEEGRVVVRALVDRNGQPEQAEVHTSSGIERLDEAAKQAVLRALFRPHIENDQAVAVYVIVPIKFQLRN